MLFKKALIAVYSDFNGVFDANSIYEGNFCSISASYTSSSCVIFLCKVDVFWSACITILSISFFLLHNRQHCALLDPIKPHFPQSALHLSANLFFITNTFIPHGHHTTLSVVPFSCRIAVLFLRFFSVHHYSKPYFSVIFSILRQHRSSKAFL